MTSFITVCHMTLSGIGNLEASIVQAYSEDLRITRENESTGVHKRSTDRGEWNILRRINSLIVRPYYNKLRISPLSTSTIFRHIDEASNLGARSYHRQIIQTRESKLDGEGQPTGRSGFELRGTKCPTAS